MFSASALLYPACYLKSKSASAVSLFLDQIFVLAPSEDCIEMIAHGQEINFMKISPILPSPLGEKLDDFKNGLKALETWGEQVGLGGNTGFETLYSALKNSENEDIQGIIGAIKGGKKEDILMASHFFLRLSMDADKRMDELEKELERVEMDKSKITDLVEGLSLSSGGKTAGGGTYFIEPLNKSRERLSAWTRTFFAGDWQAENVWPLGESISVKDLMDSAYESLSGGGSSQDVAAFSIPFQLARHCSKDVASDIRPMFSRLLDMLAELGKDSVETTERKEISDAVKEIQDSIAAKYESGHGEAVAHMVVTVYPGHSWQEVLAKAAQLTDLDIKKSTIEAIHGSLFVL